jgi:hypothetical protein
VRFYLNKNMAKKTKTDQQAGSELPALGEKSTLIARRMAKAAADGDNSGMLELAKALAREIKNGN